MWAEVGFALQDVAGQAAKAIGYKGVALRDEHGTSYLLLPGAELRLEERPERGNNLTFRQEQGGDKENSDNEISQEVFQTYLNDGIMKAVEKTVANEIGQYTNLDAMADPVAKDKARDELPYIKALLVQFNSRTIQKNVDYKDRYAAKIEYARRCFDNDERIKAGATRRMVGNEGQGNLHQNRNGTGSAEYKRGNGAAVQLVCSPSRGQ